MERETEREAGRERERERERERDSVTQNCGDVQHPSPFSKYPTFGLLSGFRKEQVQHAPPFVLTTTPPPASVCMVFIVARARLPARRVSTLLTVLVHCSQLPDPAELAVAAGVATDRRAAPPPETRGAAGRRALLPGTRQQQRGRGASSGREEAPPAAVTHARAHTHTQIRPPVHSHTHTHTHIHVHISTRKSHHFRSEGRAHICRDGRLRFLAIEDIVPLRTLSS